MIEIFSQYIARDLSVICVLPPHSPEVDALGLLGPTAASASYGQLAISIPESLASMANAAVV
jgi:hypothetical protein